MTSTADLASPHVHRLLAGLMLAGMALTAAELALLGHYEDRWQRLPLVLLACGLGLQPLRRRVLAGRAWLALMVLFAAGGIAGLVQHFRGNAEFELELSPGLGSWALVWESLRGATPALAPASLIGLGLLGLALTLCEPPRHADSTPSNGDLR